MFRIHRWFYFKFFRHALLLNKCVYLTCVISTEAFYNRFSLNSPDERQSPEPPIKKVKKSWPITVWSSSTWGSVPATLPLFISQWYERNRIIDDTSGYVAAWLGSFSSVSYFNNVKQECSSVLPLLNWRAVGGDGP